MPILRVNDIGMYYELHGNGPPLVLIAGLNSDHTLFRQMVPRFAAHHQVVLIDNRASDAATSRTAPISIELMADDTAGLLQAIGVAPAHVIGVSMGGRIAVALALRRPECVRSLILISTIVQPAPRKRSQLLVGLSLRFPFISGPHPYYAVSTAARCDAKLQRRGPATGDPGSGAGPAWQERSDCTLSDNTGDSPAHPGPNPAYLRRRASLFPTAQPADRGERAGASSGRVTSAALTALEVALRSTSAA